MFPNGFALANEELLHTAVTFALNRPLPFTELYILGLWMESQAALLGNILWIAQYNKLNV